MRLEPPPSSASAFSKKDYRGERLEVQEGQSSIAGGLSKRKPHHSKALSDIPCFLLGGRAGGALQAPSLNFQVLP